MIKLLAVVSATEALQQELNSRICSLVQHSRTERGCNRYLSLTDRQSFDFFFLEEWENQECLDEHAKSAPFEAFVYFLKKNELQVRIHHIEEI